MLEVLPIKLLSDEDALVFGRLNVELGKLSRSSLPIAEGFVVTPPSFAIQTVLNHFILGDERNSSSHKELMIQSLVLVKKELEKQPIPAGLKAETKKDQVFFVEGKTFSNINSLWTYLIDSWLDEIKQRIWQRGFSPEISKNLTPKTVSFVKKLSAFGEAYYDEITREVVINIKHGNLSPEQSKKLEELISGANKKLLIHHSYQWILDNHLKLSCIEFYTPNEETIIIKKSPHEIVSIASDIEKNKIVTKVLLDLSSGFVIEKNVDGVFIASDKIINLNKLDDSFDELIFKITEAAKSLTDKPILFKLPDIPETLGGVRGTLRILHQESLFKPLIKTIKFLKEEKKLENVQLILPFLRHSAEYKSLKHKLSEVGINRNHNLQFWMEVAIGENLLNLDAYLNIGVDGVVLNLDELIGSLYGFDHKQEHFSYLKKEINGLTKFLEENIKKLKREKIPVIAFGSLVYDVSMLEFLVHNGINGIVAERYEAMSMNDLLYKIEKKVVLKRVSS